MLTNRYRQCFAGGIHTGDNVFRANRPLGEHICLGLEVFILIQILQRAEQIVGAIIIEQSGVFLVVNQAVFCGKGIIGGIQLGLRRLNVLVRKVIQLLLNQFVDNLPQLHHTSYTAFGVIRQFDLRHDRVFSVVDLAINNRIAKILHGGVCGQRFTLRFRICDVRGSNLYRSVIALDVLYRLGKLVCKAGALKGRNGQVMTVLGAFQFQISQHHLRVVYEILVDGKAIFGLAQLHPCRFDVRRAVTLLQENNVADNIRTSVGTESVVGQTNGPQQIGSFCHVLAGRRIFTIQRVTTGNKRHHAARTHLVDGLGEKVVVDRKSQLVICLIVDLVLTERHIAHRQIVEITAVSGLKTGNGNVCLRIQFFCNAPGDRIQFHAVQAAVLHGVRQHSKEVAHTHGRLQNVARLKPHFLDCIINRANYHRGGVVGVQGAGTGGGVLIFGEQPFQFGVLFCPTIFAGVKGICQTAPAHILRKHLLLLGGGTTMLLL